MSAPLIALAKAQALGLREAASACNQSQAPLQARLSAAADSLHSVAQLAAHADPLDALIAKQAVALVEMRHAGDDFAAFSVASKREAHLAAQIRHLCRAGGAQ